MPSDPVRVSSARGGKPVTLNIAISRPNGYVLAASDKGVGEGAPGTPYDDHRLVLWARDTKKSFRLSNFVIAQGGGCMAIQADFRDLMAARVGPGDDFDACQQAAAEAVTWLLENDRPGEMYPFPGSPSGMGVRCSVAAGEFGVTLVGFRRDGTTAMSQWQNAGAYGVDGWESFNDPDTGEYVTGKPAGVPIDSLRPFYRLIEAPPRASDAFSHTCLFVRQLYEDHPFRVTPDLCGFVVLWREGEPVTTHFDYDTRNLKKAAGICAEIQGLQDAIATAEETA